MTKRFFDDAVRWETGELSLDELEARHQRRDVRGLAHLSVQLAAIAESPTPDPGVSWTTLHDQLPVRMWTPERVQRRFRRSLVTAATAAVLAGTSVAYAAGVEPVRDQVDYVVRSVVDLFSDEDAGSRDEGDQGNTGQPGSSENQRTTGEQGGSGQGGQGDTGGQGGSGVQGTAGEQGGSDQGDSDQGGSDQGGEGTVGDGGSGQGDQGSSGDQGGSDQGSSDEGGQGNAGGGQ